MLPLKAGDEFLVAREDHDADPQMQFMFEVLLNNPGLPMASQSAMC
jgi:hypothetical protein